MRTSTFKADQVGLGQRRNDQNQDWIVTMNEKAKTTVQAQAQVPVQLELKVKVRLRLKLKIKWWPVPRMQN